jgi:hypothetical protein
MEALIVFTSTALGGLFAFAAGHRLGLSQARQDAEAEIRQLKAERAALTAELSAHSAELSSIRRARMQLRYSA